MSEIILMLEVLRFLFFMFEVTRYYFHLQREKAQIAEIQDINQRLTKLENVKNSKQLDS